MKKLLLLLILLVAACVKPEQETEIAPLSISVATGDLTSIIEEDIAGSIIDTPKGQSSSAKTTTPSHGDPLYDYTDTFEYNGRIYGRYNEVRYQGYGSKLYREYNTFNIVVANLRDSIFFEWDVVDGRRTTITYDDPAEMEAKFDYHFVPKVTLHIDTQGNNDIVSASHRGFDADAFTTRWEYTLINDANQELSGEIASGLQFSVPTGFRISLLRLTLEGDYAEDTATTIISGDQSADQELSEEEIAWRAVKDSNPGLSELTFDQYCRWIAVYEAGLLLETAEFFPSRFDPHLVPGLTSDHHHYVVLLKLLDDSYEFRYVDGTGLGDSRDLSWTSPEEFFVNLHLLQILPEYQALPCGDEVEEVNEDSIPDIPYSFDFVGRTWNVTNHVNDPSSWFQITTEDRLITFLRDGDLWKTIVLKDGPNATYEVPVGDQDALQLTIATIIAENYTSVQWTDEANGWDIPYIDFAGATDVGGLTFKYFTHVPSVRYIQNTRNQVRSFVDGRLSHTLDGRGIFNDVLPAGSRLSYTLFYKGIQLAPQVNYDRPRVTHGISTWRALNARNNAEVNLGFQVRVDGEAAHVPSFYGAGASADYQLAFGTHCPSLQTCAFNGGDANLTGGNAAFSNSLYAQRAGTFLRYHQLSYTVRLRGGRDIAHLAHSAGRSWDNLPRITNVDLNTDFSITIHTTNLPGAKEYAVTGPGFTGDFPTEWTSNARVPYQRDGASGHYTVWVRAAGSNVIVSKLELRNLY